MLRCLQQETEQDQTNSDLQPPRRLRPKSAGAKGDFGHFRTSEQHTDGGVWLANYDFLLVIYVVSFRPAETIVDQHCI